MYVERLTPPVVLHRHPLLFIHGLAQTATVCSCTSVTLTFLHALTYFSQNWLNTPDYREGWASYFLRQGYVLYRTDHPQRSRSGWLPSEGEIGALPATAASTLFAAPEKVEPQPYPQANLHTQWSGSGLPGDPIFDAFYASQVQFQNNATVFSLTTNHSYVLLADHIGEPVSVVTQFADRRNGVAAGRRSAYAGCWNRSAGAWRTAF